MYQEHSTSFLFALRLTTISNHLGNTDDGETAWADDE